MGRLLDAAKKAAVEAGQLQLSLFGNNVTVTKKVNGEEVTNVDIESEHFITQALRRESPSYCFLGEETGTTGSGEYQWIIDPIDGTANFIRHLPYFAVSIALIRDQTSVLGVVYLPKLDELFWAESDGAYLNGERISVSTGSDLKVLAMDWNLRRETNFERNMRWFRDVMSHSVYFRSFGTSATSIAYLAAGRVDAFLDPGLSNWDCASAIHIAQQAGARVTTATGEEYSPREPKSSILISNPSLHPKLLRMLRTSP